MELPPLMGTLVGPGIGKLNLPQALPEFIGMSGPVTGFLFQTAQDDTVQSLRNLLLGQRRWRDRGCLSAKW